MELKFCLCQEQPEAVFSLEKIHVFELWLTLIKLGITLGELDGLGLSRTMINLTYTINTTDYVIIFDNLFEKKNLHG